MGWTSEEGSSLHPDSLTSMAPSTRPQRLQTASTPLPFLILPSRQIQHTASAKQTQTPTRFPLRRGSRRLCKTFWSKILVYMASIIQRLYKERPPAHARTTQNITDHHLNTETESCRSLTVYGDIGCTVIYIYFFFTEIQKTAHIFCIIKVTVN